MNGDIKGMQLTQNTLYLSEKRSLMTVNNNPAGKTQVLSLRAWRRSLLKRPIRAFNSSSLWWTAAARFAKASSHPFSWLDPLLTRLSLIKGPIGPPPLPPNPRGEQGGG